MASWQKSHTHCFSQTKTEKRNNHASKIECFIPSNCEKGDKDVDGSHATNQGKIDAINCLTTKE